MSGFVLHPAAFQDIKEIWEFIADENLDAADHIVAELERALEMLVEFPEMGFRREELTPQSHCDSIPFAIF
jgi:toxin ParE1/3/4